MLTEIIRSLRPAWRVLLVLSVLTGLVYPILVWGSAALIFPKKSMGQLIVRDDTIVGSELIGQQYISSAYFHSRPSASGYSALPSAASNLGPTSEVLRSDIDKRQAVEGTNAPSDLLTTSGSGLDPDISPEAARFQIERIVQARALGQSQREELQAMVIRSVQHPLLGFIGKSRTNVLDLNLALDAAFGRPPR